MRIKPATLTAVTLLLLLSLLGCDSPSPSPSPSSSPGPAPTRRPTSPAGSSSGLGATRAEWEKKHAFVLNMGSDYIYDGFNAPLFGYRVVYWQEAGGNDPAAPVVEIAVDSRLVLSDTGQIPGASAGTATASKEQMQEAAHALLPADAQLHDTEGPTAKGTFTETYRSKWIETLYPPLASMKDPWGGEPEGTIKVVYVDGGPSLLISTGKGAQSSGSPLEILPTKTAAR